MIKIENIEVMGWEAAIRGMRNPMNSWDKSDSYMQSCWDEKHSMWATEYVVGKNDLDLMMRLAAGGSTHAKYRRMIVCYLDVTAPIYFASQLDTYKIGTTRNSCSFMHKGVSKPFTIHDFSAHDSRVYEVLSPCERKQYELKYPYETDEFKIFRCENGREYKIFRNGRVVAKSFEYTDTKGRHRTFEEKECIPSKTPHGYFEVRIGGRSGRNWQLHRLIAYTWLDNPKNLNTVNHIDGDKGNNCVENLEWCDLSENIRKGFETGLYENGKSLHASYLKWKNGHTVIAPHVKAELIADHAKGMICRQLAEKYDVTVSQANNMVSLCGSENQELFILCYTWENTINTLNDLRLAYLETKDESLFQQIRCLLPSGYNQRFTLMLNYEVLSHIYHDRKDHRLSEWQDFCRMIETLPYSQIITLKGD